MTRIIQTLLAQALPSVNSRFIAYGSRASNDTDPVISKPAEDKTLPRKGYGVLAIDYLAGHRVPHNWFASFYAVSISLSLFWATQIVFEWPGFRLVASLRNQNGASMTVHQVLVTWIMMLLQGSRRLYESSTFMRPSSSQMWVGHWALGIWFYMTMSMSVWIEGTRRSFIRGLLIDLSLTRKAQPHCWTTTLIVRNSGSPYPRCAPSSRHSSSSSHRVSSTTVMLTLLH